MKKRLFFICFLVISFSVCSQNKEIEISGTISDGFQPLSGVNIRIENSEKGTKTDSDGKYVISATEGDVLVFTHIGYDPIEIITEDMGRTLNLAMVASIELLDNVTVTNTTKVRKTQEQLFLEYNTNPNLIKTQFGILDKETSGTAMYILDEENINPGATDILMVIAGKFPGVDADGTVIFIRGFGSIDNPTPAIYEIDGMVYTETPFFLDMQNVKRIAVLPALASTAKYGNIAGGGIIIINTKSGNFSPKDGAQGFQNSGLLTNNDFQNDAVDYNEVKQEVPSYLQKLKSSKSLEEAKRIYKEQQLAYGSFPHFVLDAYQFFFDKEEKPEFADSIIVCHWEIFENDPTFLKALAYKYQIQERWKKANRIFKDIFILRPNYGQSYIDLATSYSEMGEFKEAAGIYARYRYLLEEGFMQPETEFDAIFDREYTNFISIHGKELLNNRSRKKIAADQKYYNTRLVFEWNDSEAEFELQFVNPDGKYFSVEHSLFANAERIKSQKIAGYAMEEHLIDDSMLGEWQVNVRYLGNKSLTPTYLKATIYKNYGSEAQQKQTKLFKLQLKNTNQKLFSVKNSASIVSN